MALRRCQRLLAPLTLALLVGCADEATQLADHQERGDAYLEEEKYSEAIIEYKNVLQIDPNEAKAHYGLARAFLATKELRKAYWELQETARLDPQNFEARLQYGQFLLFGKDEELEEALAQADDVLEADPDHAGAYVLRGRALQALRRPDEAQAAFERAVELEPEDPGPLVLLANFQRREGHREAAEPLFRKLTEVRPGFASFAALGGFLAADLERDAEAEAAYQQGVESSEDAQKSQARRALQEAIRLLPEDSPQLEAMQARLDELE